MHDQTRLNDTLGNAGASFMPYGPPAEDVRVVETFGEYEAEYAAMRKGVGLLQTPQRALLRLDGVDRRTFVNQLVTNDVGVLADGTGCRALALNRHGRIEGDLVILHAGDELLLVTDVFRASTLAEMMEQYIFMEDVTVQNVTARFVQMSLHGPMGLALLADIVEDGAALPGEDAPPWSHKATSIGGAACRVYRSDEVGAPGWHLLVPASAGVSVLEALSCAVGGLVPEVSGGQRRKFNGRGVGWHAYNTARIEAGTVLFHVDYGPDSLPHETGLLQETVSFTKGCYPGQEIVARMENLGHPKKVIVGLRGDDDRLPIAGAAIRYDNGAESEVVGAVTSSTLSPMAGKMAIALGMMRWDLRDQGVEVRIDDASGPIPCTVDRPGWMT